MQVIVINKLRNRAGLPHAVDGIQVVVVTVWHALLRANVLAKRGVEHGALKVVRGKGVATGERVHVALLDQPLHGMTRIRVKRKRRAHHPLDKPVVALVLQQLDEVIVVSRVRGLTTAALTERELLAIGRGRVRKAVRVDVDSVRAVLASSQGDKVSLLEVTAGDHMEGTVVSQNDAGIHARRGRQLPFAINLEIFRVH